MTNTPHPGERGKTLYMIGNAHIDPVWLWDWHEGSQEIKATFRSALDLLTEHPEFVFAHSSAAHYAWIEENEIEMFREVQARVAEGRWEIVGGWWVEPDCNLPSGESLVRQGLYGQRYFRSRFGKIALVGYNPDSFGHAASLPQILRGQGLESYVFMRPGPHEKDLPERLFRWVSADGSEVLAFRIPFEYTTWGGDLETHVRKCMGELRPPFEALMCFFGVGNHGGGPTRENLSSITRLNALGDLPRLELSTPERFFAAIKPLDLPYPVVHDELQHHASGCYAAHSGVKAWNRHAEHLITLAETFSSLALWKADLPYPGQDLERAWKTILFNQFHDILGGTSLETAYDDARHQYGEASSIASGALNAAIQRLSWRVNIPLQDGARPIVVWNSHAWPSRAPMELECAALGDTEVLVDDDDRQLPFQVVRSGATVSGWRNRIAFVADLPSLGHRVYRVLGGPEKSGFEPVSAGETWLENALYRLEIDPATGSIAHLYDKTAQLEVFDGPAAHAVVIRDESDTWGHGVTVFDDEIGRFGSADSGGARVRLIECGPVKATVRARSTFGNSSLIQDFTLYRDLDRIEVTVTLDWRECHKMLKLRFPLNLRAAKATYAIPYGHIERPLNGEEEPGGPWVDLTGVARANGAIYGLSLLCASKQSFSARERSNESAELSMSVLRSPIYAHHDPCIPVPEGEYRFIDQGEQRFVYALVPHAGGWEAAGTLQRALELAQPAVGLFESFHGGPFPQCASQLEVGPSNVVVTTLKRAEDDDDLIVRAIETTGVGARARFRGFDRTFEADFRGGELKTFRVPRDASKPVVETNLLECSDGEQ